MKKVIEYNLISITDENSSTLNLINEKMEVIKEFFGTMQFTCQKFTDNKLEGETVYSLPYNQLKKIVLDLDVATDEFYLELEKGVVTQVFDGIGKSQDYLQVEVVKEEIAVANDRDFLGATKYRDLINNGDYTVGSVNSYYNTLGEYEGETYYYREL